jgi:RHS repeat-associated protein
VLGAHGEQISDATYDPWGKRRNQLNLEEAIEATHDLLSYLTQTTSRGFTGHEMLDAFGLIHMNGRVYDPELGRFLTADPFVQFPTNTQSYNRYSYVLNNPLAYTDPSGYNLLGLFKLAMWVYSAYTTADAVGLFELFDDFDVNYKIPGTSGGAFGNQGLTGAGSGDGACVPGSGGCGASGASGGQVSPMQATAGATDTVRTGGKFANGGMSASFMVSHFGGEFSSLAEYYATPDGMISIFEDILLVIDVVDTAKQVITVATIIGTAGLGTGVAIAINAALTMGKYRLKKWIRGKIKDLKNLKKLAKKQPPVAPGGANSAPKYARNKYKSVTRTEKKRVLNENETCVYCEKNPSTQVDHVRSQKQDWVEGGFKDSREARSARVNDPSNLTGSCQSCNASKGSKPLGSGEGQWTPPKNR